MKNKIKILLILSLAISTVISGCSTKTKQAVAANNTAANSNISQPSNNENLNSENNLPKSSDDNTAKNSSADNISPQPDTKPKPLTPVNVSNPSSLDTKRIGWSWSYSPKSSASLLSKYHGYAFGDTSKKIIYLTFDEGYEYGYTPSILDTLKANNVHAAFFVTAPYIAGSFKGVKNSDLLKRMSSEGHVIGNHSVHHKSMPDFTDENTFNAELTGVEAAAAKVPGVKISKNFRPPMGDFSELSLYYTQKLGYKTIFFSLAYKDYDVNNQPDPEKSKEFLLNSTKPGMICLLHAESKTNATILDSLLKEWKKQGYEFRSLDEL
ncbi:putative delta-lactam-biosynthetic de-N-acetylase [Clostridiales bacterium oral taxon 876 str. F0540]|nr:putative delta-lactam-biosynthetic de-N-acetylase [Clostridiales bacterium oral taxon 876 str. F0540]